MKDLVIFLTITLLLQSCLPTNKKIPNLIKLGIPDSFFCDIQSINANVKVHPEYSATGEKPLQYKGCEQLSKNLNAAHGYWVVRTFIDNLKLDKHRYIEIFPARVFNAKGETQSDFWSNAFKYFKQKEIDIILSAAGILTDKDIVSIQNPLLLANGIKKSKKFDERSLWPQKTTNQNTLFLTHYYRSSVKNNERIGFIDKATLFQNKIDYIVANPGRGFQSSSYALAYGAAKAFSYCFSELENFSRKDLKQCLDKQSKPVKILGEKQKYLEL